MTTAKKYKGNWDLGEIKKKVMRKGGQWDQSGFDKGEDWVNFAVPLDDKLIRVLYNTFNGKFMVRRSDRKNLITEESTDMDGTPWYDQLLDLLYEPYAGEKI